MNELPNYTDPDQGLTGPISAQAPCGVDLRREEKTTADYPVIKGLVFDARRRPELWKDIQAKSLKVLRERSKDLEVAAWLAESALHSHGFAGLATGLELIAELMNRYGDQGLWPEAYPARLPNREGVLVRFLGGNASRGSVVDGLERVPLTVAAPGRAGATARRFTLLDYRKVMQSDGSGDVDGPGWAAAVASTPERDRVAMVDQLGRCVRFAKDIETALREHFDRVPPPEEYSGQDFSAAGIVQRLEEIIEVVRPPTPAAGAPKSDAGAPWAGGVSPKGFTGVLMSTEPDLLTREQADAQLRMLAAFYKRAHPESPVGHALDRIIRWSAMDWVSLQRELLTNSINTKIDFNKVVAMAVGVELEKSESP
jgi:type VI secretion system protein ImpA